MFNKYQTSFSPQRVQTTDQPGSRKEKLRMGANKALSQNRNSSNLKNMNNTFFVTQMNKEKKSKANLNRSVVGDQRTTSHRRLNQTELDHADDSYKVSAWFWFLMPNPIV
jgi:hypothetical protein